MADDARQLIAAVAIAVALGSGCGDEAECEFTERPATVDERFGNVDIGGLREDLQLPRVGELAWESDVQELNDMAPIGVTSFTLQLQIGDMPTVREGMRVGGRDEERLACPSFVDYDVTIALTTGDGVLDERWEGIGSVTVDQITQTLEITMLDPPLTLPLVVPDDVMTDDPQLRVSLWLPTGEDAAMPRGSISLFAGTSADAGAGRFWPIARLGPP